MTVIAVELEQLGPGTALVQACRGGVGMLRNEQHIGPQLGSSGGWQ